MLFPAILFVVCRRLYLLRESSDLIVMSSQRKLSSFFTVKPAIKRCIDNDSNGTDIKKVKKDEEKENQYRSTGNVDIDDPSLSSDTRSTLIEEMSEYISKYSVLDKRLGPSWFKALKSEFDKTYFYKLSEFVTSERKKNIIFPPEDQVWSWTRQCSIDSIKVVILGQDPYHNPGQAHGLCFSVPIGVPPPPSLLNMYKELTSDIEGFKAPKHGYLVGWARQGVLLLNAVLTVRKNSPNSHIDQGWEKLTTAVIKYLNDNKTGIVFLLWGSYAQKKADFVNKKKHHILKTVHPSPLSASRGFFGSKHFSKCNEILEGLGKRPIDWNHLPEK